MWNLEFWVLESGIELTASGALLRVESRIQVSLIVIVIQNEESGIQGVESRIQDRVGFADENQSQCYALCNTKEITLICMMALDTQRRKRVVPEIPTKATQKDSESGALLRVEPRIQVSLIVIVIQYEESGIQGVESRIQDHVGFADENQSQCYALCNTKEITLICMLALCTQRSKRVVPEIPTKATQKDSVGC